MSSSVPFGSDSEDGTKQSPRWDTTERTGSKASSPAKRVYRVLILQAELVWVNWVNKLNWYELNCYITS